LIFLRTLKWDVQTYSLASLLAAGSMVTLGVHRHVRGPVELWPMPGGWGVRIRFTNRAFWSYLAECDELKP
jgi:hypothetical protein